MDDPSIGPWNSGRDHEAPEVVIPLAVEATTSSPPEVAISSAPEVAISSIPQSLYPPFRPGASALGVGPKKRGKLVRGGQWDSKEMVATQSCHTSNSYQHGRHSRTICGLAYRPCQGVYSVSTNSISYTAHADQTRLKSTEGNGSTRRVSFLNHSLV